MKIIVGTLVFLSVVIATYSVAEYIRCSMEMRRLRKLKEQVIDEYIRRCRNVVNQHKKNL